MKKLFALELTIEFYQASKDIKLPAHLRDQHLRACSSVALNLAEGSAKPTAKDRPDCLENLRHRRCYPRRCG